MVDKTETKMYLEDVIQVILTDVLEQVSVSEMYHGGLITIYVIRISRQAKGLNLLQKSNHITPMPKVM